MLAPNDRRLLLEALQPPEGCQLDYAVATTYSLDLVALLTAPIAFTFHDWQHEEGRTEVEPLALLEALGRYAERLAVFCQANRIAVPSKAQGLFAFLEERIFPVVARNREGVFHPKAWVLRFVQEGGTVRYRLLVSSRNLTFERSWYTLLVLEGELTGKLTRRGRGSGSTRALGEFLAALPGLGVHPVPDDVVRQVGQMADEIQRERFEPPEDVEELTFWPLGHDGKSRWPFPESARRLVVVSPFLTAGVAERLGGIAKEAVLVSDAGELARLGGSALEAFADIRVLNPAAQPDGPDPSAVDDAETPIGLSGLHAKLYVLDQGPKARVWTGSANATEAAFERNVELLVELLGRKARLGADALLAERKGETTFASLLEAYNPPDVPDRDEVGEGLTFLVEAVRKSLGALDLRLRVLKSDLKDEFSLELAGPPLTVDAGWAELQITCRPISLGEGHLASLRCGAEIQVSFPRISFEALTSFMAFTVSARNGGRVHDESFVLNLPLDGAPAGRRQRIIQNLLRDQGSVLRFILLLLADDAELPSGFGEAGNGDGSFSAFGLTADTVLESLLEALVREPRRLDRVAQLLEDLGTGEDAPLLPEEFQRLWTVIWAERLKERPA